MGGSFTQIVYSFDVSPGMLVAGLGIALAIGLIGGFFPALAAARQNLLRLEAP